MRQCKCGCEHKDDKEDTRDVRIVILQRGWVFVGVYSEKGDQCFIDNGFNIRLWGTSKGLGELVNGPLSTTKLDSVPQVQFNKLTVISTLKVNASKWDFK
jgi:hypothetical protein